MIKVLRLVLEFTIGIFLVGVLIFVINANIEAKIEKKEVSHQTTQHPLSGTFEHEVKRTE